MERGHVRVVDSSVSSKEVCDGGQTEFEVEVFHVTVGGSDGMRSKPTSGPGLMPWIRRNIVRAGGLTTHGVFIPGAWSIVVP